MSGPTSSDLKFEIGHVLFMDIVGYSKLVIDKQTELTRLLNEVVRNSEQFRLAESEGLLVKLPTGDGMALVFRSSPEAAAQCAIEVATPLPSRPEIKVRMTRIPQIGGPQATSLLVSLETGNQVRMRPILRRAVP